MAVKAAMLKGFTLTELFFGVLKPGLNDVIDRVIKFNLVKSQLLL
jgi:hypothetical protein